MRGPWLRSSVLWSRPRIVLVSRRSSAIANAPKKHVARARIILGSAPRAERHRGCQARPGRAAGGLARHPRWTFHFTPTSGSWLNAVETFFSALTQRGLKRGSFHSVVDFKAAINRYIAEHNHDPKPFHLDHDARAHPNLNAPAH